MLESNLLLRGTKHFFEPGINVFCLIDWDEGDIYEFYGTDLIGGSVRAGYRYQGPKGFLFRIGVQASFWRRGGDYMPNASIGYSF